MNAPFDPIQRRKSQVIAAALGINLVFGILVVLLYAPSPIDTAMPFTIDLRESPLTFGYQIATLVACFVWLGLDSYQLDIRRPWWLNLGIIFAAIIFVPYYLYKTRPAGRRMRAIASFFGLMLGGVVAMCVGMSAALSMHM